jgi:hypothetical protein
MCNVIFERCVDTKARVCEQEKAARALIGLSRALNFRTPDGGCEWGGKMLAQREAAFPAGRVPDALGFIFI